MSKERNAAALTKFAEAVNTGRYDLFDDVVAADAVDHDPAPGQVPGPKGYLALFTEMRRAFPHMKVEVAELVASEDAIAFAYTFIGTQDGALMGVPATGKKVKIRGMQISKFSDGKMVERWGSSDQLGILQQIGAKVVPKP
ncbi:MAG: ester cyclase [Acidobacteriota bacterium]|nr:ester cyclase [Acidobacteriota bacterium]